MELQPTHSSFFHSVVIPTPFLTLMLKRVDESWEARVCMRVFSTLMSWSNEDKLMRVEKRKFVWEFSQLFGNYHNGLIINQSQFKTLTQLLWFKNLNQFKAQIEFTQFLAFILSLQSISGDVAHNVSHPRRLNPTMELIKYSFVLYLQHGRHDVKCKLSIPLYYDVFYSYIVVTRTNVPIFDPSPNLVVRSKNGTFVRVT